MIGKLTNHNLVWSHVENSCTITDKAINLQSMGSVKEAVKFVTIYNKESCSSALFDINEPSLGADVK